MKHVLPLAALLIAALPALAQQEKSTPSAAETILSAQEFEAMTTGKTLYFNRFGEPYGAEQYFADRRVIWTFLDGRCERGAWYNEGDTICFVYETQSEAQCWKALKINGKTRVRILGDVPSNDLVVVGEDQADLHCPGPGVGVSYTPAD
ncbi:MAG: hypothetical protein AAGA08_14145 [Pseudomonadota bacterium]